MAEILQARVEQKTATEAAWLANSTILLSGEQAFVLAPDGLSPMNFKIGDGTKAFSALPYWINYAAGLVVPTVAPGGTLPNPGTTGRVIILAAGTFTQPGGGTITAAVNAFNVYFWNGTSWGLAVSIPITVDLSGYATTAQLALKVAFTDIYSKNLLNPNDTDVVLGKFLAGSGALTSSASYNTSGFIPVTAATQVSMNAGVRFIEFYTAKNSANYTGSLISVTPPATSTQTVPAGATYMRVTFLVTNWASAQVELGATSTAFVAYGIKLNDSTVDANNIKIDAVTTPKIKDANVTQPKLSFLTASANLLMQGAPGVIIGKFLSGNGALTNGAYNTSDFIAIAAGTQFSGSAGIRFIEYYTAPLAANYTGSLVGISGGGATTQTVPVGASYMRITYPTASWALSMVNLGASVLPYVKAGYSFDYSINLSAAPTSLNWTSEGDSITAGTNGLYQTKAASTLYLNVTNTGVAGSKMGGPDAASMWQDARVNVIPTTTQILTVLCGTNDWAQSELIGAMTRTNVNTNEFVGALNVWLGKIYARILATTPLLQIFVMTTTVGHRNPAYPSPWGIDGYTNAVGLTTNDYAEALRQWAKMWNLRIIDTNLLWNSINTASWIPAGDGLHPNVSGLDLMSQAIIDKMINTIRFNS